MLIELHTKTQLKLLEDFSLNFLIQFFNFDQIPTRKLNLLFKKQNENYTNTKLCYQNVCLEFQKRKAYNFSVRLPVAS